MIDSLQKLFSFLKYWYFRYMLVTELYMVEKWERNFIIFLEPNVSNTIYYPISNVDIFLVVLFVSFFLFNFKILLPAIQYTLLSKEA